MSDLQSSQQPDAGDVRAAVDTTLRDLGVGQCAARVAQEFGDHPETAIVRIRWAMDAVAAAYRDASASQAPDPARRVVRFVAMDPVRAAA